MALRYNVIYGEATVCLRRKRRARLQGRMPSGVNSSRPIEIRSYDPIDLPGRAKQSLKSLNENLAQTLRKLSPKCHTYYQGSRIEHY